MKTNSKKKMLTFGGYVSSVYDACGKRKARGIVRLAVNTHLVRFLGPERYVVS